MSESNEFHYFASHAMGWVKAPSADECIEKLLLKNTEPKWANNCLKAGTPLTFFICRVPLAPDADYRIEWYAPNVKGLTECRNVMVTYLTRTKFAVMDDPDDMVRTLKDQLAVYSGDDMVTVLGAASDYAACGRADGSLTEGELIGLHDAIDRLS